jgi:purine nucleosidase
MKDPIALILDVDTGVDDALALLFAAACPGVEVVGATAVMGNVTVDTAVTNTQAVLELAGLGSVEVARGAARPLVRDHEPFSVVHGQGGLGEAVLPPPSGIVSPRSAASLIVETARERPGEVLLVATGPLTNIALALSEEPELPALLRGFALMGGSYTRGGNATPAAESNTWIDPDAAQAVFRGFDGRAPTQLPRCIGLDVTERVQLSRRDLEEIIAPAPGSPIGRFLADAVPFYIEFYERTRSFGGACMHDPLALALALDPSMATWVTTRVEVESDGIWTRGMTVTDLDGIRHSPWPVGWESNENAVVALGVEASAFMTTFVERLRFLVGSAVDTS